MKNKNTPVTGRGNGEAGAHDSTANQKQQSITSQRTTLMRWLQSNQRITTLEARNILGIMSPAARIQELRKAGHDIATLQQWATDAAGKRHKQALYVLLGGAA